ncbi:MAG: FAD-dependent oxidoreductase, partial [Burkholderiaceae bacterium]
MNQASLQASSKRVLVIGAGPVGLVAAIDLAQRGIPVTVIERRATPHAETVRCNHIAARTMEIFRRLGFVDKVRGAGFRDDFPHDVAIR